MPRDSVFQDDPCSQLLVGSDFRLADIATDDHPGCPHDRDVAEAALRAGAKDLGALQDRLFASSRLGDQRRILLVLQAMDASGKGGIVAHVVGAVNPEGVEHTSFKRPTVEERSHDVLWRVHPRVPGPGMIGVFDRSHYEDVLVPRVHGLASPDEIDRRYDAIRAFEAGLTAAGTTIVKVMLHISLAEQRRRLLARLDDPTKHWKFEPGDIDEREHWTAYQDAYQRIFERTSTPQAPWYVIPADHKWYSRLAVQHLLTHTLERMDLTWPAACFDVARQRARLA